MGPASTIGTPARRAARTASCGAFSSTIRPDQTAVSPPGPAGHCSTSTPLSTTVLSVIGAQAAAVCRETAAKELLPPSICTADSSHHRGGVCRVVSTGIGSERAIATGR